MQWCSITKLGLNLWDLIRPRSLATEVDHRAGGLDGSI